MNGIGNILDAGISGSSIGRDFLHRMQAKQRERMLNQYATSDVVYRPDLFAVKKEEKTELTPKKHINYSAKKHSTQILQAKKSINAKTAATKIKLALRSLYAKRHNDDYDQEELETDIAHAESMERIAKKKAVNLKNEELAEHNLKLRGIGTNPFEDKLFEELEKKADPLAMGQDDFYDDFAMESEEGFEPEFFDIADIGEFTEFSDIADIGEYTDFSEDPSYDMLSALTEDMTEAMDDILEDETIDEMFDELGDMAESVNSEEDLEEMKRKHRIKEWKEIMKADTKYMKDTLERLNRNASKGMGMQSFSAQSQSYGPTGVSVSAPTMPEGVSVDVAI